MDKLRLIYFFFFEQNQIKMSRWWASYCFQIGFRFMLTIVRPHLRWSLLESTLFSLYFFLSFFWDNFFLRDFFNDAKSVNHAAIGTESYSDWIKRRSVMRHTTYANQVSRCALAFSWTHLRVLVCTPGVMSF